MKYIDLSHQIYDNMPVHPYDQQLKLTNHKSLTADGYNDSLLQTGMHVGTHIDCPSHLLNTNDIISEISVDRFIGSGVLLDCHRQDNITIKDEYQSIKTNQIVLIYTGFSKFYNQDIYYKEHPVIDKDFALFLVNKKIKMIGIDFPSPDYYPFEVHKIFLENNILIIENLTNLDKLLNVDKFEVYALPLKIRAEGSLTRVIAEIKK